MRVAQTARSSALLAAPPRRQRHFPPSAEVEAAEWGLTLLVAAVVKRRTRQTRSSAIKTDQQIHVNLI
eukprot:11204310-Lingulodinium_polyedra.AAC.1